MTKLEATPVGYNAMKCVLFSTTTAFGSRLIRWATNAPVSHTAILLDGMVWESRFLRGVSCMPFNEWACLNVLIAAEYWPKSAPDINTKKLAAKSNSWYDVGALCYLALCYFVGYKPDKNLWNHPGARLCTEYVSELLLGKENSVVTPWELRAIIQDLNT